MTDPLDDLADTVRDLCDPYTHREPLDPMAVNNRKGHAKHAVKAAQMVVEALEARSEPETRAERVRLLESKREAAKALVTAKARLKVAKEPRYGAEHPGLLAQLEEAIHPGSGDGGPMSSAPAESSAPWNEAAAHALETIRTDVNTWMNYTRTPWRPTLAENIRALVGAATLLEPHDLKRLSRDAHSWRVKARVEIGWDRPTMTIDTRNEAISDACPCCEKRRTLRVRGDGTAAWCTSCGAAWSEGDDDLPSVQLLANELTERASA